jgi:hypothetical protein
MPKRNHNKKQFEVIAFRIPAHCLVTYLVFMHNSLLLCAMRIAVSETTTECNVRTRK